MGKPADSSTTADRSHSWARSLTWAKSAKHSSSATKSELPIVEPRVGDSTNNNAPYYLNTSAQPAATHAARSGSNISSAGNDKPVKSSVPDEASASRPAAAPPPVNTEAEGEKSTAINGAEVQAEPRSPLSKRAKAGSLRFVRHTRKAIFHSWINVLLIFVPLGIIVKAINLNPSVVFAMNAVAVVPLAGLLAHATESVASRLGDTLGALLNVSFGNAVELIIL
jgi:Ca2+:H+ antiporter